MHRCYPLIRTSQRAALTWVEFWGYFSPSVISGISLTWYWSSADQHMCLRTWNDTFISSPDDLEAASSLILPLILTFVFDGGKVALMSPSSPYSSSSGLRSNAVATGHVASVLAPDWHWQTSASTPWSSSSQTSSQNSPNIHEIASLLTKAGPTSACYCRWPAVVCSCKCIWPWHSDYMKREFGENKLFKPP